MKTLYVHVPFCERKCFYCSFVITVGQVHRVDQYLDCLEKEAQLYAGEKVKSVYIGGGTPTLMNCAQLSRLLGIIEKYFDLSSVDERTIESNPEGLNHSKLKLLKQNGITRISLGIQSLNDCRLKLLGRNHGASTAVAAFYQMRDLGFDNINVDLMFGFPGQMIEELRRDVAAIVELDSEHLSLYALTIEEHSRFFAQHVKLADGCDQARQYQIVCNDLKGAGFEQYEVSNFSKGAKVSEHNLNYWQGGEYIGLGVGAHSYIGSKRFWNVSKFNEYMALVQNGDSAEEGFEELTAVDQMMETVLFGLRMNQGIDMGHIQKHFNCELSTQQQEAIADFIKEGLLVKEKSFLKVSDAGRLVLDGLCVRLL